MKSPSRACRGGPAWWSPDLPLQAHLTSAPHTWLQPQGPPESRAPLPFSPLCAHLPSPPSAAPSDSSPTKMLRVTHTMTVRSSPTFTPFQILPSYYRTGVITHTCTHNRRAPRDHVHRWHGGPVADLTYDVAYTSGWQTFYPRHSLTPTPSHRHRLRGLTVSPTHSSLHHEPQGAWATLPLEGWFIHSLIRSFNKHNLKQYFMTSSVLDTGDMKEDHTCSIIREPRCAIWKSR